MKILSKSSAYINERIKNIPQALRDAPFWCCFKLKPNPGGGKPQKIPLNPVTNIHAKVNDPATLCSFDDAAAGVEAGRHDGLNYAFGYNDLVGIDLDGVLNPETGELTQDAAEICRLFKETGAYVEVSPSGTGLRIISKGTLPRFGKGSGDFKGFEVYGKGVGGLHFLSITGNAINATDPLPNCQDALDWFYKRFIERPEKPAPVQAVLEPSPEMLDEEVLELAKHDAKNGAEFLRLYYEGIREGEDHSAADLRLLLGMVPYTQNIVQLDRLFRGGELMRPKWERADYRESTIKKALAGLRVTYQPRETRHVVTYGLTEREAARRFLDSEAAQNFQVLRQARTPRTMRFNGAIWVEDFHTHELMKAVSRVSKNIIGEMTAEENARRRDQLYTLAKKIESRRGLHDVTALVVMGLPEFLPEKSDTCHDYFLVGNGVLRLNDGVLFPHEPDWLWTKQAPVVFNAEAECPLWLKFIDEFCCEDKDLALFFQTWFGYCASGYTTEHKMLVLFGSGANGKSVMLSVMMQVLGSFAAATPADTLLQRKSEQTNDIAALEGVRLAIASESDEGQALAEGRIKALTGGDIVTCRRLFEEYRTYTPRFKLVLATNAKPRISGTDNGIWRRLLLVPCNAVIANPDRDLAEKLKKESSGILNWLVDGFKVWKSEGLAIPDAIRRATEEYRTESDTIGRFLAECCNPYVEGLQPNGLKASSVYGAYRQWSIQEGFKPLASTRFGQRMAEKGFRSEKKRDGFYYPWSLTQPR